MPIIDCMQVVLSCFETKGPPESPSHESAILSPPQIWDLIMPSGNSALPLSYALLHSLVLYLEIFATCNTSPRLPEMETICNSNLLKTQF